MRGAAGAHLPIDVVYTWVNGSDPRFVAALDTYQNTHGDTEGDTEGRSQGETGTKTTTTTTEGGAIGRARRSTSAHERRRRGHGGGGVNATAGKTGRTLRRNRYRDNDELRYSLRSLFRYVDE